MKKNCLNFMIIAASFIVAVAGVSLGLYYLVNIKITDVQTLRQAYLPPVVMIDSPQIGSSAAAGSAVLVNATILNRLDTKRVELWVDGNLVNQITPDKDKAQPPLHVTFDLIVPSEGLHTILVRAVNTDGIIGSSVPLQIMSVAKPTDNHRIIKVTQEQDIQQIADTNHMTREEIEQANPNLPTEIPPGTSLTVPLGPEGPSGNNSGGNPQPTATPPGVKKPMSAPTPTKQPTKPTATFPALKTVDLKMIPFQGFTFKDTIPPAAPTDLQDTVDGCTIKLTWMDNADNESTYTVNYINTSSQTIKLATLQSSNSQGHAWYQFPAPQSGHLTFWVEAVNDVGSTASNYVPVDVGMNCPDTNTGLLQIEAVKYDDSGGISNYEKFYCYISLDNNQAFRVPAANDSFIYTKDGPAGIATYLSGGNKVVIPRPKLTLIIQVKCMGWYKPELWGPGLFSMGFNMQEFPESTWDGSDQVFSLSQSAASTPFKITLHIRPFQPGSTPPGIFGFDNPSLPAPYSVTQKRVGQEVALDDPQAEYEWYWNRLVQWEWDGDRSKISGFRFYLNGKPVQDDPLPNDTGFYVTLPDTCGLHVSWQVAAYAPNAQSSLSPPVEEDLPQCQKRIIADISIPSLTLGDTRDGPGQWGWHRCDTLDTYLKLFIDGEERDFLGGGFYMALNCYQTYDLNIFMDGLQQKYASVGGPSHFQLGFYVPVEKGNFSYSNIKFDVGGELWEQEDVGSDDLVASFKEYFWVTSYDNLDLQYPYPQCRDTGLEQSDTAQDSSWKWCVKFSDAPTDSYRYPNQQP